MVAHTYSHPGSRQRKEEFENAVRQLQMHHKILKIMIIAKAEKLDILDEINSCLTEIEKALDRAEDPKARKILLEDAATLGKIASEIGKKNPALGRKK